MTLRTSAWLVAAALPMAAFAQNQPAQNQPQQQAAPQQQPQAQGCQPTQNGNQRPRKSFVKDTGNAVASTAGSVAGGAVAGPVGAAVGGVVVDHVGHAVKKVVKGKKKKTQPQDQQAAADNCGGQGGL
jgi:hypothetical protein